MSAQPAGALKLFKRLYDSKIVQWILTIALTIALFVMGVIFGRHGALSDTDTVIAPISAPAFSPALGDTDAVLSLQIIESDGFIDHTCTATLIEPEWAVTAAHCVNKAPKEVDKERESYCTEDTSTPQPEAKPYDPAKASLTLRGRTKKYAKDGETGSVASIHLAPGWSWERRDKKIPMHDLALLKLAAPMTTITPVEIATDVPRDKTWTLANGWGTPPTRCGEIKDTMEQWALQITPCNNPNRFEVCASTNGSIGPCQGTSGGPLFTMEDGKPAQIIAVYSHAPKLAYCGQAPGTYTVVSEYQEFISTTIAGK